MPIWTTAFAPVLHDRFFSCPCGTQNCWEALSDERRAIEQGILFAGSGSILFTLLSYSAFLFTFVAMRIMLCIYIVDQVSWAFGYDITAYNHKPF
jgi:hypothetical protein